MGVQNKKRLILLDFLKIFLAFLVVCIHCNTFLPRDVLMSFGRIAVPIFFICSGFFAFSKEPMSRAKLSLLRYLKYLLFALVIFSIYDFLFKGISFSDYITNYFNADIFRNLFLCNLNITSGYHIWFLVALFFTGLVHLIFVKLKWTKSYPFIAIFLLIGNLLLGSYSNLLGIGSFEIALTRNALFTGIPFFMLGFYLKQIDFKITNYKKYILLVCGVIFACLQILEIYTLKSLDLFINGRLYLSSIISAILIFTAVISIEIKSDCKWFYKYVGTNTAFFIYIFHVLFKNIFSEIGIVSNSALLVFATTLITGIIIHNIIRIIKEKINFKKTT